MRKIVLALALILGSLASPAAFLAAPGYAQAPPPVPAEPDAERRTRYTGVSSVTTFNVGFDIYGDGTDYASWLEVWVNGVQQSGNWSLVPVSGSFTTLSRPILAANANVVFSAAQTGTVDIVGARRPRRTSQLAENRGVTARDFNQIVTDLWMTERERWDRAARTLMVPAGETMTALPPAASRLGLFLCFDGITGAQTLCAGLASGTSLVAGAGITLSVAGSVITVSNQVTPNTQSTNYSIQTTDCGKAVVVGGGLFTITLPAAAGFPATCDVTVKNSDTYPGGRGKILSGFPADLNTILWPLQATRVKISGGAWVTTQNPGRWKNPSQVTVHVDKTNGLNTNDGLAAGAGGAVADAQTAWNSMVYRFDTQGTTPIIAMACSQAHTVQLSMGGPPLGSNLIQLSPDGNCSFTWTNAAPCIILGDQAEIDINLTFFGGSGSAVFGCNTANAASSGNIYLHNAVVVDFEGTPVWNPAGANDNFFFCDGLCQFTIANGVTQATAAGGNYVINMSAGGHGTQSGAISASASGSLGGGVFYLFGGAILNRGTSDGGGWASVAPSKVFGHATLVTNGTTTSGGVTVGTSGVSCTSLTSNC